MGGNSAKNQHQGSKSGCRRSLIVVGERAFEKVGIATETERFVYSKIGHNPLNLTFLRERIQLLMCHESRGHPAVFWVGISWSGSYQSDPTQRWCRVESGLSAMSVLVLVTSWVTSSGLRPEVAEGWKSMRLPSRTGSSNSSVRI